MWNFFTGWPLGFEVQNMFEKRMSSAEPALSLDAVLNGSGGGGDMAYQACVWCMRNPQLGCDPNTYCRRIRGKR